MKKVLMICNTHYQIIIAIQMKMTIKKDESVSILISDHSNNANIVAEQLKKEKDLFEDVYYIETKQFCKRKTSIAGIMSDISHCIKGADIFNEVAVNKYDEVIYYNFDLATVSICEMLYKKNKSITCARFEEGILSYPNNGSYRYVSVMCGIRKVLGKLNISKRVKSYYCFYPDLYTGTLTPISVPIITQNSPIINILKSCFPVNLQKHSYREKYIFFTSVYDFEGEAAIGESEAVREIAELVGSDNLLVKKHPRDSRKVYEELNLHVDNNSSMPWEIIQFQINLSDKVLLTVNSGSVLSSVLMLQDGPKAFYVYNLCDLSRNSKARASIATIKELLENEKNRAIFEKVGAVTTAQEILC